MEQKSARARSRGFIALLMALVLALGMTPHAAWADGDTTGSDSGSGSGTTETFSVALTVIDESTSPATVVKNVKIDGMTADKTVADLLTAAGFTKVDSQDKVTDRQTQYYESWGSPYFLGKGYDSTTGNFWVTCFNGSSNNYESAYLTSALQKDGRYQYIYGTPDPSTHELSFAYSTDIFDPLAMSDTPGTDTGDNTPGTDPSTNPGTDTPATDPDAGTDLSGAVASFDQAKAGTLIDNLASRFSKGGTDAALTSDPAYASLGLNALGKGGAVDADALAANLASEFSTASDEGTFVSAGRLAKYVMAFKAAGVDPTAVSIDGTTRNLVQEMNDEYANPDHAGKNVSVFNAVWVLAANDATKTASSNNDALISTILASQNSAGLFGFSGWEDSETTSQALLALLPHKDAAGVSDAIAKGESALRAAQQSDGRFAYNPADLSSATSDIDTTAYAIAALTALGQDPSSDSMKVAVAYLTNHADATLDGYKSAGMWDEFVTSSSVLMGLVAWQQAGATGTAYDVYVPKAVTAQQDGGSTMPSDTTDSNGAVDADSTTGANDMTDDASSAAGATTMPQTSDHAGTWALVACVALGAAGASGAAAFRRSRSREGMREGMKEEA